MSPRRPASLLAVAALTLGVSACSGDPEPIIASPSPSPTSSESATPSPTDDPMVVPGDETAEEFIRRWQEETLRMQLTGDSSTYRSLTSRCSSCDALADEVDRIYGSGGSIEGGGGTISSIESVGQADGQRIFEFTRVSRPMRILDSEGGIDQRFSGGEADYQMNLVKQGGSWKVLRISQLV